MNSSQLHLAIRESRVIFGDSLIVLCQGEARKSCGRVASMQPRLFGATNYEPFPKL